MNLTCVHFAKRTLNTHPIVWYFHNFFVPLLAFYLVKNEENKLYERRNKKSLKWL